MIYPKGIAMHTCHMVMDFQFGSTGKGLLAGWLAKRNNYDTVVCSFATNAGHTYIDNERGIHMMTQQLPTGISSPTVKNVMIGPGALVDIATLSRELSQYRGMLARKRLFIHPAAAIVTPAHGMIEQSSGMSKIGSTTKGVGAAAIQRINRDPNNMNVAGAEPYRTRLTELGFTVSADAYRLVMEDAESILVEGAQGFSLSMYHGFYPFTTSRDVTPWQIAADCGLPFKFAPYIQVWGTIRTYPIRVNNRDGSSGPGYHDQQETTWEAIGQPAELTTVTKLPRRVFEFSHEQLKQAHWHCGQYYKTFVFLNFANYVKDPADLNALIQTIESPGSFKLNPPEVVLLGFGPDDADVKPRGFTAVHHA